MRRAWWTLIFAAGILGMWGSFGHAQTCTPMVTLKTSATLAWTPGTQPSGVTATGFLLEQQTDTGTWAKVADVALATPTYVVQNLAPGHTYTWRVNTQGKLADGSAGQSAYASQGTPPPCVTVTVIVAPTNLTATPQ